MGTYGEEQGDGFGYGAKAPDVMKESVLLAACAASEVLPQNPDLPADVFTACLTTPIKACYISILANPHYMCEAR